MNRTAKKDFGANALLLILSIMLTLIVSDVLAKWWFQVPPDYLKSMVRIDPTLNPSKRLKPRLDITLTGPYREFRFRITTDEEGFRRSSSKETPVRNADIVFLGDSQTVGVGVNDHQTYPSFVAEFLGASVLNTACYGYSNLEELELLRQILRTRSPRIVVLGFFAGNDPYENYTHKKNSGHDAGSCNKGRPVYWDAKNYLIKRSYFYNSLVRLRRYDIFNRFFYKVGLVNPDPPLELAIYKRNLNSEGKFFWSATEEVIMKMQQEASRRGARLVVLFIPDRFQVDDAYWSDWVKKYQLNQDGFDRMLPNRHLQDFCDRQRISFLDVTAPLRAQEKAGRRVYWTIDNHLSTQGNRTIAVTLADFLKHWGFLWEKGSSNL